MIKLTRDRVNKMDKKGFTLVELISVIVVLSLIVVLVAPSILDRSKASKLKSYETKVSLIETSATLYGQDNYRNIINGVKDNKPGFEMVTIDGVEFYTQTIKVKDLVPDYVEEDVEEGPSYVIDPRENGYFLDEKTITVRVNASTRKVSAEFHE